MRKALFDTVNPSESCVPLILNSPYALGYKRWLPQAVSHHVFRPPQQSYRIQMKVITYHAGMNVTQMLQRQASQNFRIAIDPELAAFYKRVPDAPRFHTVHALGSQLLDPYGFWRTLFVGSNNAGVIYFGLHYLAAGFQEDDGILLVR
jgi:hypothetical protein